MKTYYMYKVINMTTGRIVMFEGKQDANQYVELMKEKGLEVKLNGWTWKTEIEK